MHIRYEQHRGDRIVERDGRRYMIRTKNHDGEPLVYGTLVYVEQQSRWGGMFWRSVGPLRAAEIMEATP